MKIKKLLFTICFALLMQSINAQDFNIYVSDAGNFGPPNKILKYDPNGENPEVFIDEHLNWPQDILFLEDQGVVLISNLNTGRITKYDSFTGDYIEDFATVPGGPTRMEIGPDNFIYVLQWGGNGRVLRYQQDGTFEDEFTTVQVVQSIGIEWDSSGNLYVSSFGGSSVRKFDSNGNDLGLFINTTLNGPTNIKLDTNGDFLVLGWNSGTIERFDIDGNHLGTIASGLNEAEGIDFYPNGDFVIGHGADASVKLFDSTGTLLEEIVPTGSGGLIKPNAVILRDTSLSLNYVNSQENTTIFENSVGRIFKINSKLLDNEITISIFDLGGKLISTSKISENLYWNSNAISNGIYIAKTTVNNTILTQKITIKKQ